MLTVETNTCDVGSGREENQRCRGGPPYAVLVEIAPYCTVLYCTVMYCTALFCLYCAGLQFTVLKCTVP